MRVKRIILYLTALVLCSCKISISSISKGMTVSLDLKENRDAYSDISPSLVNFYMEEDATENAHDPNLLDYNVNLDYSGANDIFFMFTNYQDSAINKKVVLESDPSDPLEPIYATSGYTKWGIEHTSGYSVWGMEHTSGYHTSQDYQSNNKDDKESFIYILNPDSQNFPLKSNVENSQRSLKLTSGLSPKKYAIEVKKQQEANRQKRDGKGSRFSLNSGASNGSEIGDVEEFQTYEDGPMDFELIAKNENIDTQYGPKTVEIWCFTNDSENSLSLSAQDAQVFADKFLKQGYNNDIYDGMTGIMGPEWADSSFNNTIKLLFYDINSNNANKDMVNAIGYFAPYTSITLNNSLILFVDLPLALSNVESSKDEVISTIVHEFQHMIDYSQRGYYNNPTAVWFNESMSMISEDMMRFAIGYKNLSEERVVSFSNKPYFRHYPWESTPEDAPYLYSSNYSFMSFIVRNYGGLNFVYDILSSDYNLTEQKVYGSIEEVLSKRNYKDGYINLLRKWGVSVFLTEVPGLKVKGLSFDAKEYSYNDMTYVFDKISFSNEKKVFAINKNPNAISNFDSRSNKFFYLGKRTDGLNMKVSVPKGIKFSVIKINAGQLNIR